jgi:hypothetical protein
MALVDVRPVLVPLHMALVDGLVTAGVGFTVTVYVNVAPTQPLEVGVIR